MTPRDKDLQELEALVEQNRNAFDRARRLLSAMKERNQDESELKRPLAEASATVSGEPSPSMTGGSADGARPGCWLDLERLARVELGPKEHAPEFLRCALSPNAEKSWRPQQPGQQTIRLVFAVPQSINKVRLLFIEEELERTQEFVLRWLPQGASVYQEIVRQQYVFSPSGSTRELEEYQVELKNLQAIELSIFPDISDQTAFASLAHWALSSPVPA